MSQESLLQTLEGNSAKNDFLDLWDFQINPDRVEVDLTSTSSDQKPTETTQTKQKRKRSEEEDKASLRDSRMIDPPIDEGSADDLAVTLVKRRRQTKGKRKRSEEEDEVSLRDSRMATPSPDQGSADDLAVTLVKRRRLMASSMSPAAPIAARKKVKASLKEVQPVSDEEESMYDSLSEILEDEWMGDSQSEPSVDEWHLSETSGDDWMYCSLSEASEASEESSEESSDDRDSFSFSFDTQPGISVATNIERLVDHCFEHNVDDKESSREDQRVQKLLEEVKFRLEQRGDPSDDLAEVEHKEHMDRVQVYLAMIDQIDAWSDEITKRLSKRHKKAALVSMLLRRNSLLHKIPQLKQRQRPSTLLRTMMAGVSCWISRRLQTHFLCVRPIYFGSSMSFLRWNMQMTAMSGDRSDTYELGISTDQLDHDETTQQLRIPRVERSLRSKESERQRGEKSPLEEQNDSESLDLEKTIKAARAETRPSMLGQLSGAVEYIAVRMGCDVASYVSKEQLMDGKAAERIAELGRLTLTRLAEEDAAFQQRLTAHGNKWPKARAGISEQHKAWWTPTFIQNKQKYTGKLYSRKDRA